MRLSTLPRSLLAHGHGQQKSPRVRNPRALKSLSR
nr:MAG TPA: hypothetical protein [Caudoviricetes sp.]